MKYLIRKIWNAIVDYRRKRFVFKYASSMGLDLDGDIVWIKGTAYYAHILNGQFKRKVVI